MGDLMMEWLQHGWAWIASLDYSGWVVWTITISLLLGGLLGAILPFVPGPLLLFAAGILHTILRPEAGMGWPGIALLTVLLIIAYVLDFTCSAIGARWFGASRWGIAGVFIGAIVGMFFGLLGMLVGPVIGTLSFEILFAKKTTRPAIKSTWGVVLGTGMGIIARVVISVLMIAVVIIDIVWL
jgi:uncharacterized protein YqgC (DUF456 family)